MHVPAGADDGDKIIIEEQGNRSEFRGSYSSLLTYTPFPWRGPWLIILPSVLCMVDDVCSDDDVPDCTGMVKAGPS